MFQPFKNLSLVTFLFARLFLKVLFSRSICGTNVNSFCHHQFSTSPKAHPNGCNKSQHCKPNNVGSCWHLLHGAWCMQTNATAANLVGGCLKKCGSMQTGATMFRYVSPVTDQWRCWYLLRQNLTGFKLYATSANTDVVPCKRMQHVRPNNIACCWPTMLRSFAWAFSSVLRHCKTNVHLTNFRDGRVCSWAKL